MRKQCKNPHFQRFVNWQVFLQGVPVESVLRELRRRFGTSGIDEKAARKK